MPLSSSWLILSHGGVSPVEVRYQRLDEVLEATFGSPSSRATVRSLGFRWRHACNLASVSSVTIHTRFASQARESCRQPEYLRFAGIDVETIRKECEPVQAR
jgi:hypothetical protein